LSALASRWRAAVGPARWRQAGALLSGRHRGGQENPGAVDTGIRDEFATTGLSRMSVDRRELLAESLGWALLRAGQHLGGVVVGALEELDLNLRTYVVLAAVLDGTPRSQIELSLPLGIDKSLLVIALDGLEQRRLLSRVVSPYDRRARMIEITDQGADLVRRAHHAVLAAENTVVERVTRHHQFQASDLLALCHAIIADTNDPPC
jgi:DNA-binding MarR family transcriptional regulator